MGDSHLCKLSLQLVFVTLSWNTTIMLPLLELIEEDCFGIAQLHLKQAGIYAGLADSFDDFVI